MRLFSRNSGRGSDVPAGDYCGAGVQSLFRAVATQTQTGRKSFRIDGLARSNSPKKFMAVLNSKTA